MEKQEDQQMIEEEQQPNALDAMEDLKPYAHQTLMAVKAAQS